MDVKKYLLAGLAGFVVMFLLSGLWYMVIMADFYQTQDAEVSRGEINLLYIALGYVIWGALLAYIYPIGYKGGTPLYEGLRFGVLIGLLVGLPMNLVLYGVWKLTLTGILVDAVWQVVEKGVGGIVIALVYGTDAAKSSS